ncbi:MAG: hypothetical protein WCS43_15780, partial [Verrucomicrobiota bacterium]
MFQHRLPQGDEGCQHVGFDFLAPRAFVRPDKNVCADQLRDFLARDRDADDFVIAEDRRFVFQRAFEREQVEGFAVDRGVVQAQDGVAFAGIASLGGGHEDPACHRQVLIVQQVGEELAAIPDGFVRLVHDAEIEAKLRRARGHREGLAALVGGEYHGEAVMFPLQPGGDLARSGEAWHAEVLPQDSYVVAFDASGGFIAAHANPFDGLVVGHR